MTERQAGDPTRTRRADIVIVVAGRKGVEAVDPAALKRARKAAGLRQADVGARLGHRTGQAVSEYETGTKRPDVDTLAKLAAIYGVTDLLDLLRPGSPVTLQTLRVRAGLRQADVADRLTHEQRWTVSRSLWAAIERAERVLQSDEVAAIAKVLGADPQLVLQAVAPDQGATPEVVQLDNETAAVLHAEQRAGETLRDTLRRLVRADRVDPDVPTGNR